MKDAEHKAVSEAARAIADGKPVDWSRIEAQTADEPADPILSELRIIEDIAMFHRDAPPVANDPPPRDANLDPILDPTLDRIVDESRTGDRVQPSQWGHLTIVERIGGGASGRVYRARDDKLDTEVALKLVTELWGGLEEARRLARVRHPHVVLVYGADRIDGHVGLWMELVKGQTLATLLRSTGPLSAREAISIGIDLCGALAAIHAQDLIHGDIKVHNVMREDGGRIVLMDFGAAKDLKLGGPAPHRDFAGTPLYLPPEIFTGAPRTRAADIYALGVLLYHLVTGSYPVQGQTVDDVERAHAHGERTHLRDARADLPDAFVSTIERAVSRDPAERFQTAGALERALSHGGGTTKTVFRTPVTIVVALLTLAALVAGVTWRTASRDTETRVAAAPLLANPAAPLSYRVQTAMYRDLEGQRVRLRMGERLEPGAQLFAEVRTSIPTYVYLINEDDRGSSYTLFPMPDQSATNPLPAESTVRLPGKRNGQPLNWVVDKPGQREHFLVFVSPTPLSDYEKIFDALPRPQLGKPVAPLPTSALGALRSVGGLTPALPETDWSGVTRTEGRPLSQQFTTPLGDGTETVSGVWIRQLTLDNPLR